MCHFDKNRAREDETFYFFLRVQPRGWSKESTKSPENGKPVPERGEKQSSNEASKRHP